MRLLIGWSAPTNPCAVISARGSWKPGPGRMRPAHWPGAGRIFRAAPGSGGEGRGGGSRGKASCRHCRTGCRHGTFARPRRRSRRRSAPMVPDVGRHGRTIRCPDCRTADRCVARQPRSTFNQTRFGRRNLELGHFRSAQHGGFSPYDDQSCARRVAGELPRAPDGAAQPRRGARLGGRLPGNRALAVGGEAYAEWRNSQPETATQWLNALPANDPRREPFFRCAVWTLAYNPEASEQLAAMTAQERAAARTVIEGMTSLLRIAGRACWPHCHRVNVTRLRRCRTAGLKT